MQIRSKGAVRPLFCCSGKQAGRVVEQNRVEYKEGWNSNDIIHTIFAFANGYSNYEWRISGNWGTGRSGHTCITA